MRHLFLCPIGYRSPAVTEYKPSCRTTVAKWVQQVSGTRSSAMRPQLASVAFKGGGVVLSAQTPYDREVLVEYLRDCLRAQHDVRLNLGPESWRVERVLRRHTAVCSRCRRPLRDARCRSAAGEVECVWCALDHGVAVH